MMMTMAILFLVLPLTKSFRKNKVLEDAVMPNDEDIDNEVITDDYDSLASVIDPSKTKFW